MGEAHVSEDVCEPVSSAVAEADVELSRETFILMLLRELTGSMVSIAGEDETEAYVARVGALIGEWLNAAYHAELGPADFDARRVAQIFVDLKDRIGGDFTIESIRPDRIVLVNRRCPFGPYVRGRASLCKLTSNVFGRIGAQNLGYARVELDETIAGGGDRCVVVVHLTPDGEAGSNSREFWRTPAEELADRPHAD
jgi:predicted ArsR family transcriptional regulator